MFLILKKNEKSIFVSQQIRFKFQVCIKRCRFFASGIYYFYGKIDNPENVPEARSVQDF